MFEPCFRRPNLSWTGVVFLVLMIPLCISVLTKDLEAGCINYDDYLHWVSSTSLSDLNGGVCVSGTHAYLTGASGLTILDISNESNPTVAGTYEFPVGLHAVDVTGTTAVVVAPHALYFMDVSDPADPTLLGQVDPDTTGNAHQIVVAGNYAYVTMQVSNRLVVVDFSDPENPFVATSLALSYSPGVGMAVSGDYLYMTTYGQLLVVDISVPSSAHAVGSWVKDQDSWRVWDFALSEDGNYAFVTTRHSWRNSELHAISIMNPNDPYSVRVASTPYGGDQHPYLASAANILYLGVSTYNYQMYEWAGTDFVDRGVILRYYGSVYDMYIEGANLYVLAGYPHGLHAISVQSPSPLEPIGSVATPGTAEDVVVALGRSDLAYVADGYAGLQVVDVTDPLNPTIIGTVDTPGYAVDIALLGTTVFVADSSEGIQAVDVTTPSTPSIVGFVDTPGHAVDIALTPTHAYVADAEQGVRVIDIQVPSAMAIVGVQDTLTASTGIAVSGNYAYVADGASGLVVLNAEDPSNPWIIDGVKNRRIDGALKVDYSANRAYVTVLNDGLVIVDVTVPENPTVLSDIGTEGSAGDLDIMGIFAYVGSGSSMQLVDIRDGDDPLTVGTVKVPEQARGMFINENYAYVAAAGSGLQVCPTQCGFDEHVFVDFLPTPQADFYPITVDFTNLCEGYGLSYVWDFGDGIGTSIESDPTYSYTAPGDYPVQLTVTNGTNTDSLTIIVSALAEEPTITSVVDIPDDQGGFVYLNFYHSGYDDTEPNRMEMYSIQRLDGEVWVNITSVGCYGSHYYSAQVNTLGDGPGSASEFRVIAHMDEGIWISESMSGYSEDNIAPEAPENVIWLAEGHLGWDPVAATDFAYYRVYGSQQPSLDEAVSLGTTVETDIELGALSYPFVLVVAVDDNDLESDPSMPMVVTDVQAAISTVQLSSNAIPNPFNPSTKLQYALPATGLVRLSIYSLSGRLVRVLVDGIVNAGYHEAVWDGRDDGGQGVASGVYFYRLRAGGVELTERMVLVK